MDGEYKADRPLTEAERLVNAHYLGHCLHDNRKVWKDRSNAWGSRCIDCQEEIAIEGFSQARRLPDDILAQAWSREHIKTAASMVNAAQVQYALEKEGWRVRIFGVDGRSACAVYRGGATLRTPFFDTQAEAVVEAAARTLENYITRHCTHLKYMVQSPH